MSEHFIFSHDVGVIHDIIRNGGNVHFIENGESIITLENIFLNSYKPDELKINKTIVTKL